MSAILVLLLLQVADLDALLAQDRCAEVVRTARDPEALLQAVSKLNDPRRVGRVVRALVRLDGIFKDPTRAAEWLVRFSAVRHGDPAALAGAGYCYLVAKRPADAAAVLAASIDLRPEGYAMVCLADAYTRLGKLADAAKTLKRAAKLEDAPASYLKRCALRAAGAMRRRNDPAYPDLLEAAGMDLQAALWLAEDLQLNRTVGQKAREHALALFAKGLDPKAPAEAFWTAARLARGETRFRYLIEAVQRGNVPGALLDLARECAKRKRHVAAADLALRRLRIGECPAAWELLESLPPGIVVRRP